MWKSYSTIHRPVSRAPENHHSLMCDLLCGAFCGMLIEIVGRAGASDGAIELGPGKTAANAPPAAVKQKNAAPSKASGAAFSLTLHTAFAPRYVMGIRSFRSWHRARRWQHHQAPARRCPRWLGAGQNRRVCLECQWRRRPPPLDRSKSSAEPRHKRGLHQLTMTRPAQIYHRFS